MNRQTKIILSIIILVAAAALLGWTLGRSNKPANHSSTTANSASSSNVKALASYTLPDGWSEDTCSSSGEIIYIIPNGSSLDCSANPSAPVKIYIDSQNTTDCQQLKPTDTKNIKKHVCSSLYISGHKSLMASTQTGGSTVSSYYINTGKGVITVEYDFSSTNDFQEGFDQLAKSVKTKS